MMSRRMRAAILCAALTANVQAAEIEIRHINDLFSASPVEDDLYTATLGVATSVDGWTFDLDEYLFTDKSRGQRFDETYLTAAKELLGPDSRWSVRARAGAVRTGRGLYGQRLQNFVHTVLGQDEVDLPYVENARTHGFARLNVGCRLHANRRMVFSALIELEAAGFKEHARFALGGRRNLGEKFALHAEIGTRFSDTDYAPLIPWIEESEPTFAAGVSYKRYLDLTWTANHFGTGDNHWHLSLRAKFGAAAKKQN